MQKHLLAIVAASLGLGMAAPAGAAAEQRARIFVGKIITMDKDDRIVQAVGVDRYGVIAAVGDESTVRAKMKPSNPETIRLAAGETLLPGFFDPHVHVVGMVMGSSGLVDQLSPCLPAPYASGTNPDCKNTIEESLQQFGHNNKDKGKTEPLLGTGLDPSRQPYSSTVASDLFKANPAFYIADAVSAERPVVVIDQSGHFGYVNKAAFKVLKKHYDQKGMKWPPVLQDGGQWATVDNQQNPKGNIDLYTGLLQELGGLTPFLSYFGIKDIASISGLEKLQKGIKNALSGLREAGVTTVMSMVDSKDEYELARAMTQECKVRIGLVVPPAMAQEVFGGKPTHPSCTPDDKKSCVYPTFLGVSGVKTIIDGSIQGCTGAMQEPQQYAENGGCYHEGDDSGNDNGHGNGRINYPLKSTSGVLNLRDTLSKLWDAGGWRFESHANGPRAMEMALNTYGQLRSGSDKDNRVVLIHSTIGSEKLWELAGRQIAGEEIKRDGKPVKLQLHFTHLIGHIPYWGGVFQNVLVDKVDSVASVAQDADPFAWDKKYAIPYSMHSDAPVSPSRPLWFVRQAATRQAWTYPELGEKDYKILGPQHRLSVREALRAVTINPAVEKGLDKQLGSIEPGKVADFVRLSGDPLAYDCTAADGADCSKPNAISRIKVLETYLGGQETKGNWNCAAK